MATHSDNWGGDDSAPGISDDHMHQVAYDRETLQLMRQALEPLLRLPPPEGGETRETRNWWSAIHHAESCGDERGNLLFGVEVCETAMRIKAGTTNPTTKKWVPWNPVPADLRPLFAELIAAARRIKKERNEAYHPG